MQATYLNRLFPKGAIEMAYKHMKRCLTASIIREMKLNLRRYRYTPPGMAKARKTDKINGL